MVVILASPCFCSFSAEATPAAATCEPDGGLQFLCGPRNVEDLVQLGGSRWLIGSGMDGVSSGTASARGHLYLIDPAKKAWQVAFPGTAPSFRQDRAVFSSCPGPVNPMNFSAHGLALKARGREQYRLYVVGHGEREAIEVFDVDARRGTPLITWTGCVVLPEDVLANSVAILPDGGFITTKFLDRRLPTSESMAQARQGKPIGALYEWHPGGNVTAIAGTELAAPNGIEVSADGKTLYVAVFGTHEFVRFVRGANGVKKDTVPVAISPDNVRWGPSGKLLTTGGDFAGPTAPRTTGWSVLEVDPNTLAARVVGHGESSKGRQARSVALAVGDNIWVGTFNGDRVGYFHTSH